MSTPAVPDGYTLGSQDLHVHTNMSDGSVPLERVVQIAAERGVQIGIADHVSARNPAMFIATIDELEDYLRAIDAAPVLRAAELCWCDEFSAGLTDLLKERLDYLIGSNHGFALPDGSFGSPWWKRLPEPWDRDPQHLMEIMVANLCDLVRTMPIQIVAHSTLMPPALRAIEDDVHAWWTEEREDRFVEAVAESGVAMEISNRYRVPHDRLLTKAYQAGVNFSLGSDGHHEDQIGRLEWSVATARRIGIGTDRIFAPQRG